MRKSIDEGSPCVKLSVLEVGRVIVSKLSFLDASSVVRKCETPTVENMQTKATSSDFPIFVKVVFVVLAAYWFRRFDCSRQPLRFR